MNIRFFALFAGCCFLLTNGVSAQVFSVSDENDIEVIYEEPQAMPKPISLIDNTDEEENVANTENVESVDIENYDSDVSYYVQSLNLSPEQLYEAQKISTESMAEQEELFQKIAALRQQARALEVSTLLAFEAILNDSQRAALQELRAGYEAANTPSGDGADVINVE